MLALRPSSTPMPAPAGAESTLEQLDSGLGLLWLSVCPHACIASDSPGNRDALVWRCPFHGSHPPSPAESALAQARVYPLIPLSWRPSSILKAGNQLKICPNCELPLSSRIRGEDLKCGAPRIAGQGSPAPSGSRSGRRWTSVQSGGGKATRRA